MFRVWPLLIVALILAACSSAPTRRESASAISTPHAWKPPADLPAFIDHSVGEEEISIQAMSLVGVPYRWGGNTPDAGFDCSGLVRYVVARSARVDLPRTTSEMSLVGSAIQPDEVAPGDLIYFNTTGRPHSHVGIYVGGYRFVNAPSTGGTVRIDYVSNPYWAKRFDGIRRVASVNRPAAPFDTPQLITSINPEPAASRNAPATTGTAYTAHDASDTTNDGAPAASARAEAPHVSATGAATASNTPRASAQNAATETHDPAQSSTSPVSRSAVGNKPVVSQRQPTNGPADAFEPPPPSRAAAESQAAEEHATSVDPIAAFAGTNSDITPPTMRSGERPSTTEVGTDHGTYAPAGDVGARSDRATVAPSVRSNAPSESDDPISRFATGG